MLFELHSSKSSRIFTAVAEFYVLFKVLKTCLMYFWSVFYFWQPGGWPEEPLQVAVAADIRMGGH